VNLTTATPAEIDAKLAELYVRQNAAEASLAVIMGDIHRYAGDKGRKVRGRGTVYNLTDDEAIAAVVELSAGDSYDAENAERILLSRFDKLAQIEGAQTDAKPLDAEFNRRGGWSRFFLVTSSNGHIHSSMNCSTCHVTTAFAWLPDASGQTMADAIAERDKLGSAAILCTVCFPDAPVEWTTKPVDDTVCPGSGTTDYDRATARRGYYSGNFGICNHCGQPATIPGRAAVNMRKHKKA
jgi:hypothetical protein